MKAVEFIADRVKVRTGKQDDSGDVVFEVGEYMLPNVRELVGVQKKIIRVRAEIYSPEEIKALENKQALLPETTLSSLDALPSSETLLE